MTPRFIFVLGLLVLPTLAAGQDDTAALKARIAELEKENAALKAELAELRGELHVVAAEKAELETKQTEAREQRQAMYIVSQYDPEAGKTRLASKPVALPVTHGSRAQHYLQISAEGQGRDDKNPTVTLTLSAYMSGRVYHTADALSLSVDGKPMSFKVAKYERDKKMSGSSKNRTDRSDEYLTFRLTADDVREIGKAASITGQAGPIRYEFSNDLIRLFNAAAESIDK